jgi:site-specific DNA-cytosine methylase
VSNISGDNSGLKGPKSGLFYDLIRVIKQVKPKYILIENNYSMKKENKLIITRELEKVYKTEIHMNMINSTDFGVQSRKRIYWTNFNILTKPKLCLQTWDIMLEPYNTIKKHFLSRKMIECINRLVPVKTNTNTRIVKNKQNELCEFISIKVNNKTSRWDLIPKSDSINKNSQTFVGGGGGSNNILIDRRFHSTFFYPRYFTPIEVERLFQYTDNYTNIGLSKTARYNILGNSVVNNVISYILQSLI